MFCAVRHLSMRHWTSADVWHFFETENALLVSVKIEVVFDGSGELYVLSLAEQHSFLHISEKVILLSRNLSWS